MKRVLPLICMLFLNSVCWVTASAVPVKRTVNDATTTVQSLLDKTEVLFGKIYGYSVNALITNANDQDVNCQIISNAKLESDTTSLYANLIDDDYRTCFKSLNSTATSSTTDYHNLQIDISAKPVQNFKFLMRPTVEGTTDFPSIVNIYATNDENLGLDPETNSTEWEKIGEFSDIEANNYTPYLSELIGMDQTYKYLRFSIVNNTTGALGPNSFPCFQLSEFQIYGWDTPTDTSEYKTVAGLKEATDILYAKSVSIGQTLAAGGTCSAEDSTALIADLAAVQSLYVEKYDTAAMIPNKWYNIMCPATETVRGSRFFSTSLKVGVPVTTGYNANDESGTLVDDPAIDPYAIWRFVPVEGQENQYYIQVAGTGQYMGPLRGNYTGGLVKNSPVFSHEPGVYEILYYAKNLFKLHPVILSDYANCLYMNVSKDKITNSTTTTDGCQLFKVSKANWKHIYIRFFEHNNMQIVTMPWEMPQDITYYADSSNIAAYDIMRFDSDTAMKSTTLYLKRKHSMKAGEPAIYISGDYSKYNVKASLYNRLTFDTPTEVIDTTDMVTNGLVPSLGGVYIHESYKGFIYHSAIKVTMLELDAQGNHMEGWTGVRSEDGRGGYIDPDQITPVSGDADLVITSYEGAMRRSKTTGIQPIILNGKEFVNVYSIDGKLLKKNVQPGNAFGGLSKGVYIIGNKKILVR